MMTYYELHKEERKAYYQANKEKRKAYNREYKKQHKEEIRISNRVYEKTHKEERSARSRAWKDANPEKIKANNKVHSKTNKRKASNAVARARRRARLTQIELVAPIEIFYRDQGMCQLCKEPIDWNNYNLYPTLDHIIPVSKGGQHTKDNIQLVHRICNQLKSNNQDKLISWYEWLKYNLYDKGITK